MIQELDRARMLSGDRYIERERLFRLLFLLLFLVALDGLLGVLELFFASCTRSRVGKESIERRRE